MSAIINVFLTRFVALFYAIFPKRIAKIRISPHLSQAKRYSIHLI